MKIRIAHLAPAILLTARLFMLQAAGPDPSKPFVETITYGGSGCPQGTVGQSISDDRTVFTLIFDSFVASSGPGIPSTETKKNCQINVSLRLPRGFSAWVETTTRRGYAQLSAGLSADLKATYNLSKPASKGEGEENGDESGVSERSSETRIKGPVAKDYAVADGHDYAATNGCDGAPLQNRTLRVNLTESLTGAANLPGQITTDSIDGKIVTTKVKSCGTDE